MPCTYLGGRLGECRNAELIRCSARLREEATAGTAANPQFYDEIDGGQDIASPYQEVPDASASYQELPGNSGAAEGSYEDQSFDGFGENEVAPVDGDGYMDVAGNAEQSYPV